MEESKKYKRGMIKGALWLTISGVIVKVLGLIYKIPLSYLLTDEGMGYFNSAYTVYTFFYLICSAGIPKAISILTSEAESEGKREQTNQIYKAAFLLFSAIGLIATLILILVAEPIADSIRNSRARFAIVAIAPSVFFTCITGVIRGYFNGTLKFAPIAISESVSGIGRLSFGLILAYIAHALNYSSEIISAFTILGTTIGSFSGFVYMFVCKKSQDKKEKTRQNKIICFTTKEISRKILKLSIPIAFTSAVGSISSVIDLTLIMRRLQSIGFSEFQTTVIYGNYTTLAIPMLNLIGTLVFPLSSVLLPFVSKASLRAKPAVISERISFVVEILLFFVIPSTILFSFRAREILLLLFEDSSAVMAAPLLVMLVPAMILMSLESILNTTLEGLGETKIPLISLLIGACVKGVLTFLLIGNEKFEILGAPISTSISYLISFLISLNYVKFVKKIEIKFIPHVIKALFCSLTALLFSWLIGSELPCHNTLSYLIELFCFAIFYVILISILNYKYLKERFFSKTTKSL